MYRRTVCVCAKERFAVFVETAHLPSGQKVKHIESEDVCVLFCFCCTFTHTVYRSTFL